ncbi:MAG: ABC transporter ATP-binding protein [Armatimonadetes bacterium]|nr:ABC transporter ATP-binding protein [Armatimonadota bacterium]
MSTGRRLWGYAAALPWHVVLTVLSAVLAAVCMLAVVVSCKPLFNMAAQAQVVSMDQMRHMAALLLLYGIGIAIGEFGYMYLFDYVAQSVVMRLRGDLFAHLQSLPLGYFEDASTGALVSHATNDLGVMQARMNFDLVSLVRQPVTIVGLLVYIVLKSSWELLIVAILVGAVLSPVLSSTSRLMKQHAGHLQDRMADLTSQLTESLGAIRVVQSFGASDLECRRFDATNAATRRAMMRTVRVRSVLRPVIHVIILFGVMAVVGVGGVLLKRGRVDLGDIVVVVATLQMMSTAFKELGRARLALSESLAASAKVFGVMDTKPELVDAPDAVTLGTIAGRLEFQGVHFHYKTGGDVLCGIDLTVEPGQTVAVVGSSGSGKTSLANLIPRLYDVTDGALLVDGHDVRAVTRASLRAQIGIVPQQTVLFRGTVADNIAYGKPEASHEEIEAAARAANAHDFVSALPLGYDTEVGERGAKLSGGQAQRIAIARAILRDPRILILDEATSALDSESEALVQEALDRLMQGRTSVVIAHRLSTVQNAHRIVVLDHGQVVENGTPAELLARPDSVYRRFHDLQTGEVPA